MNPLPHRPVPDTRVVLRLAQPRHVPSYWRLWLIGGLAATLMLTLLGGVALMTAFPTAQPFSALWTRAGFGTAIATTGRGPSTPNPAAADATLPPPNAKPDANPGEATAKPNADPDPAPADANAVAPPGFSPAIRSRELLPVRQAAVKWASRRGPNRRVLDQVVLVPDAQSFFAVLSQWDEQIWFPILWDDPTFAPKFLEAFRPARILRISALNAQSIPTQGPEAEALWNNAVKAVGHAWWREQGQAPLTAAPNAPPVTMRPPPDARKPPNPNDPRWGPTPPAAVISHPGSPSLLGAAALAAGRFQPLIRVDPFLPLAQSGQHQNALTAFESIESAISQVIPQYDELGDDCDFLTLAGNWTYQYEEPKGVPNTGDTAFDDRLGRGPDLVSRWAYVGRLIGDAPASLYRAMCALFLQPRNAALFNTYEETSSPWNIYSQKPAQPWLARLYGAQIDAYANPANTVADWHKAFPGRNTRGLVIINTSGHSTGFNIPQGRGQTGDIPDTVPNVIHCIHSHSAANPFDPNTLAGRWMAQGTYIYFGAVNEPFLQSFRTPVLIAMLASDGLPLSVVFRASAFEHERLPWKALPWRLAYLGDPLYSLEPARAKIPKIPTRGTPGPGILVLSESPPPKGSTDITDASRNISLNRLRWANDQILLQAAQGQPPSDEVRTVLSDLEDLRASWPNSVQNRYDDLIVSAHIRAGQPDQARTWAKRHPDSLKRDHIRNLFEMIWTHAVQDAVNSNDLSAAAVAWNEALRSPVPIPQELQIILSERLAAAGGHRKEQRASVLQTFQQLLNDLPNLPNNPKNPRIESATLQKIRDELQAAP